MRHDSSTKRSTGFKPCFIVPVKEVIELSKPVDWKKFGIADENETLSKTLKYFEFASHKKPLLSRKESLDLLTDVKLGL